MGILDLFKRKDNLDDLELPKEGTSTYEFGSSGDDTTPTMPGPTGHHYDPYGSPPSGGPQGGGGGHENQLVAKELEIISSKLDSIRATLESLNQRVASLERVAYGEQNYGGRRY